jgi:ribonuclease BN (tRNA processing enzyme)
LAKPGPTTVRYGGNTACVEVRTADGTLIMLDCGTGAHEFGQVLAAEGPQPVHGHLLITHTHWDHIQGFPFFSPLFAGENEWDIYAPGGLGQQLEAALAGHEDHHDSAAAERGHVGRPAHVCATDRQHRPGRGPHGRRRARRPRRGRQLVDALGPTAGEGEERQQ